MPMSTSYPYLALIIDRFVPMGGLRWGVTWGVRWDLTWGLEKVKLLVIRELSINRGGLGENNKIQGFVQVFTHGAT